MSSDEIRYTLRSELAWSHYDLILPTECGQCVSHEVEMAEKEFESFRVEQDKCFESDFDRMVKKYLAKNAKNEKQSSE